MPKDPLMPDDGDEIGEDVKMELTSHADFEYAAEVMAGLPAGSLQAAKQGEIIASHEANNDPRAGVMLGPFFLSESGHLHRSAKEGRTRVDLGLLFQNIPVDKLYELLDNIDGELIPIAANHYYRVMDDGCIRLHRHWGENRTYLSSNSIAFVANVEETKKVLKRLFKDNKDILVEAKGDEQFKVGNKKVGELESPDLKQVECTTTPIEEDIPADTISTAKDEVVEGEFVNSVEIIDAPTEASNSEEATTAASEVTVTPAAAHSDKKKKKYKFNKKSFG